MPTPIVVFVHGQTLDASVWDPVRHALGLQGITTTAPDLPGHGDADEEWFTYGQLGVAIADHAEALGQQVALVGHSLGTLAVLEGLVALDRRGTLGRVDRILLIGLVGEPDEHDKTLQAGFAERIRGEGLSDAVAADIANLWFGPDWAAEQGGVKHVRALLGRSTPKRVIAGCEVMMGRPTIAERLPDALPPATIVELTEDAATPAHASASLKDALDPVRVQQRTGHHLWPYQEPADLEALVRGWLRGRSPEQGAGPA